MRRGSSDSDEDTATTTNSNNEEPEEEELVKLSDSEVLLYYPVSAMGKRAPPHNRDDPRSYIQPLDHLNKLPGVRSTSTYQPFNPLRNSPHTCHYCVSWERRPLTRTQTEQWLWRWGDLSRDSWRRCHGRLDIYLYGIGISSALRPAHTPIGNPSSTPSPPRTRLQISYSSWVPWRRGHSR